MYSCNVNLTVITSNSIFPNDDIKKRMYNKAQFFYKNSLFFILNNFINQTGIELIYYERSLSKFKVKFSLYFIFITY